MQKRIQRLPPSFKNDSAVWSITRCSQHFRNPILRTRSHQAYKSQEERKTKRNRCENKRKNKQKRYENKRTYEQTTNGEMNRKQTNK